MLEETPIPASKAAKMLGISVRAMYALGATGQVPTYRIGRAVRFLPSDVEGFFRKCLSGGAQGTRGGGLSSTVTMKAAGTGLASYFRKAGVEPKLTPTTGKKARDFPLSLVALPERNPS
jgi:excisionase family DNA binding protein